MKKPYTRELSLEELAAISDEEIDFSDIPELDGAFWENAGLEAPISASQELKKQ